jgi:small subunit ribosomal protein S27Ae
VGFGGVKECVSRLYKIGAEGRLIRLRPFCPRCGEGYFMADFGDRYVCGRCHYTIMGSEYKRLKDQLSKQT